ncbi:MAG: CapA family protein, partial [Acidimicrobiales bacterium]
ALAETGYDACTTASNHSFDKGVAGVAATLAVLDVKGIPHAGTARSQAEAELTTFLLARGVKVALLSYAYGLNGFQLPEGQTWLVNLIDPGRILADAEAARARGAEFVVVSLHWGAEYRVPPTQAQRDLTGTLLASPAIDLILGHHAHVVQPIERLGSKYVVYGMGNFLSGQSGRCCAAATQSGIIARLLVEETDAGFQVRRLAYTPTWVEPGTFRVLPVAAALDAPGLGAPRRAELAASWRRTVTAIASLGELGVVPAELPAAVP